jgi:hypothetical protein
MSAFPFLAVSASGQPARFAAFGRLSANFGLGYTIAVTDERTGLVAKFFAAARAGRPGEESV